MPKLFSVSGVKYSTASVKPSIDDLAELPELTGHWKFDEASGLTATDSAGSFGNGTLQNMVGDEWATGKVGGGLLLDGVNDVVNISGGHPNIFDGGGTFMGWMKHTTGVSAQEQFFKQGGNAYLRIDNNEKLYFRWNFDGASHYDIRSDSLVLADTLWHHYAITYNADSVDNDAIMYFDGSLIASTRELTPVGTRIDMSGVTLYLGGQQTINGLIDDYRFYGRKLNASEIKSIYDLQV